MVSSGLEGTRLDVASYRLATHLGLAFLILGYLAWSILQLGHRQMDLVQARRRREAGIAAAGSVFVVLLFLQILIGALVAGIDAGLSFTDWPTMGGGLLPPDMWVIEPLWRNLFENGGTVQFIHRIWGYALFAVALVVWWVARRSPVTAVRRGFDWMLVACLGQIVLGIGTILYTVPWQLAITHQFGAVVLFVLALRARFLAQYPPEQRIARA